VGQKLRFAFLLDWREIPSRLCHFELNLDPDSFTHTDRSPLEGPRHEAPSKCGVLGFVCGDLRQQRSCRRVAGAFQDPSGFVCCGSFAKDSVSHRGEHDRLEIGRRAARRERLRTRSEIGARVDAGVFEATLGMPNSSNMARAASSSISGGAPSPLSSMAKRAKEATEARSSKACSSHAAASTRRRSSVVAASSIAPLLALARHSLREIALARPTSPATSQARPGV
jgi:hypothetical protein